MKLRLLGTACACLFGIAMQTASAVTFNFSNIPNSNILFNPTDDCGALGSEGCFSFTPDGSDSLTITSGTASGLLGHISGLFAVSSISGSPPVETATVSNTGMLSIFDGGDTLTASLDWLDITTIGTFGGLNIQGMANLSSISYGGSNSDLVALSNAGLGIQTLSFQFTAPVSLTDLFNAPDSTSTSFSGSITVVPLPAALWLMGSALVGLTLVGRRTTAE